MRLVGGSSGPANWATAPGDKYSALDYEGVYPGIDLIYQSTDQGLLDYTFVVKPGASPGQIDLSFTGVDSATLDLNGDLVLTTAAGNLTQQAPVLYQINQNGDTEPVAGRFEIRPDGTVGFAVSGYDTSRALYIDPTNDATGGVGLPAYAFVGQNVAIRAWLSGTGSAYPNGYFSFSGLPGILSDEGYGPPVANTDHLDPGTSYIYLLTPSVVWDTPGLYTFTVSYSGDTNGWDDVTGTGTVRVVTGELPENTIGYYPVTIPSTPAPGTYTGWNVSVSVVPPGLSYFVISSSSDPGQVVFDGSPSGTVGDYTGTITITTTTGSGSSSVYIPYTVTITDGPLQDVDLEASGNPFTAMVENSVEPTVAVVTDFYPSATVGHLTAMVDWGDGSPQSTDTISEVSSDDGGPNTFDVSGDHTYLTPGLYLVTVQVTDTVTNLSRITRATAFVEDGVLNDTGVSPWEITVGYDSPITAPVAAFTDTNSGSGRQRFYSHRRLGGRIRMARRYGGGC